MHHVITWQIMSYNRDKSWGFVSFRESSALFPGRFAFSPSIINRLRSIVFVSFRYCKYVCKYTVLGTLSSCCWPRIIALNICSRGKQNHGVIGWTSTWHTKKLFLVFRTIVTLLKLCKRLLFLPSQFFSPHASTMSSSFFSKWRGTYIKYFYEFTFVCHGWWWGTMNVRFTRGIQ